MLTALGCATSSMSSGRTTAVALGPGGRAEGRLAVARGEATRLRLDDRGPGGVDVYVRLANGVVLSKGVLDRSFEVGFTPVAAATLVVVLESRRPAAADPASGAAVDCTVDGAGGAAVEWDLSAAAGPRPPGR